MTDKKKDLIDSLETHEDATGFLRAAGLDWQFSGVIAQLYEDSSMKGVEKGLKFVSERIREGNTDHLEELLLYQAELLNHLFITNTYGIKQAETVDHLKVRSQIALKAQNQSRRTIMALADLKSPKRATFIKNQNNAVNQQVNVGDQRTNTDEVQGDEDQFLEKIPTNEIIEELNNGKCMDTRTKGEAERGDPAVEALGEGLSEDRAEDARG